MVGMTLPGFRRQVPARSYFDAGVTQVTRVAFIRSLRIRVPAVIQRLESPCRRVRNSGSPAKPRPHLEAAVTADNATAPVTIAKVGQIDTTSAAPAAPITRRLASLLYAAAPVLLIASVAARLAWTYLAPNGANFVDLHVYFKCSAAIDHPGTLYGCVYADQTPDFPLPFTYPPFAAVVFYPLHLLPFGLVAFGWTVGTMVALYGVVRISQRLLGVAAGEGHRMAMLWTGVAIWLEPLRSTFDYGQINVLLVLATLAAVYTTRWWLSGLLVGTAAGAKLTPAIAGLYFVGARRWGAAAFSAVVFLATIAVSALVVGDETRYYFTDLIFKTDRIGPICTIFHQSWRGGICRIFGHDAGYSPLVLTGIAVTAILSVLAWRALSNGAAVPDRLGTLLVVELFGLLLSPISWTHHWVWLGSLVNLLRARAPV